MPHITLFWTHGQAEIELNDSENARKLFDVLPCVSQANTWGDEIYFEVPVTAELTPGARQVVDPGTVCFWCEGKSVAIPFGPTPVSEGDECRLVTKVNILGKLTGDAKVLQSIKTGTVVRLERTESKD